MAHGTLVQLHYHDPLPEDFILFLSRDILAHMELCEEAAILLASELVGYLCMALHSEITIVSYFSLATPSTNTQCCSKLLLYTDNS